MSKFKVSTTGHDIYDDERYQSINSDYGNLMIIDEVSLSGATTVYNHGLGYLPTTLEFYKADGNWYAPGVAAFDASGNYLEIGYPVFEYDTNNIYIDNYDEVESKIFISGNAADNQTGSGKNTASGKIKIAKEGVDASSATDVRQFKFCSGLDMIKKDLSLSGSTSVTNSGIFSKTEITHNLGYFPVVVARLTSNTYDSELNNTIIPANLSVYDFLTVSFIITQTKVIFYVFNVYGTFNINYNIYRNKIA